MNPATSLSIYSPCWCKREAITKKLQGLHTRDTLLSHPIKWFGLFKVRKKQKSPPKGKKNEFGNQRRKHIFIIIFKSVQACWTDAAIQYMYIFFARSISLWTGSLDKAELANRTAVIFFVFAGQTEARVGQAFLHFFPCKWLALCTCSHSPERHKKIMPVLQAKEWGKYKSWKKKKRRRTGKGEGRDNLPLLFLIPPSLPATSLEANSSWVLPKAVCLQATALFLWLANVHT